MGRPKRGAEKPASEPNPDARVAIIHLKGTEDYAAWIDEMHRDSHIPKATIFRLAVAEWAERKGYRPGPEL